MKLMLSTNCIRPCDTNNSTQSIARMYPVLQLKAHNIHVVQKLVGILQ